jgi:iron-sulfur cluster assembly protein
MTLTERAADRLRAILTEKGPSIAGLRVGVKNGGCAGMEYTMSWVEAAGPFDEVIEDKGVRILVDAKAVMFLLGTVMDFRTAQLSSQFVFENPNQTSACGCGESVAIAPRKDSEFEDATAG